MEKQSWTQQAPLHHVGMGRVAQVYGNGKQPSEEARELLDWHELAEQEAMEEGLSHEEWSSLVNNE